MVDRHGRVLVVHRPEYDDWSLPKGKLEPGETWEEAALREVEEETGLRCRLGVEAGRARYEVSDGPKEVRYFRMEPRGEASAASEVDELRWLAPPDACALLTHEPDRRLVAAVARSTAAGER